ncbi:hypothetical protein LTR16_003550, partial [Cryomyces antarcticus]
VGGGASGLTVANRLSEDPTVTVLVLEAGPADNGEVVIEVPQFVGQDVGGRYDWNLTTTPQTFLDGAARPMPQGRALGGGTILNAMLVNRGGQGDYNDWEALGNPGWSWTNMLPYFMKSERYTPVYSEDIAAQFSIRYDPGVHGFDGPLNVSYPKYFYNASANFFDALTELGIPTAFDPNDGTVAGASFLPVNIDPVNMTRSTARKAYYDPYAARPNLWVATEQHVTRLIIEGVAGNSNSTTANPGDGSVGSGNSTGVGGALFGVGSSTNTTSTGGGAAAALRERTLENNADGELVEVNAANVTLTINSSPVAVTTATSSSTATTEATPAQSSELRILGVEFAPDASATRRNVSARREVIVAAGSRHTVQVLQLSGIGPRSLLEKYQIPVAIDLPGVGQNLQDHYLVGTFYPYNNHSHIYPTLLSTNASFNAAAEAEYYANRTGPWTAGSPDGVAFPSLPDIVNGSTSIADEAEKQADDEYLVPGLDATVVAGYGAQKSALIAALLDRNRAAYEIINNNAGSLTVATMRPFTRGTVQITSSEPFQPPAIDPRYGSNPIDLQVLVAALKFNRRILATPSMLELQPAQFVPPVDANDDALMQIVKNGIRTEYHPAGTCAMLPLGLGGVVSPRLQVYGTQNLRIVDASIFPILPASHLQAVVYGVAEKAADIIKADWAARSSTSIPLTSASAQIYSSSAVGVSSRNVSSVSLATISPIIDVSSTVFSTPETSLPSTAPPATSIGHVASETAVVCTTNSANDATRSASAVASQSLMTSTSTTVSMESTAPNRSTAPVLPASASTLQTLVKSGAVPTSTALVLPSIIPNANATTVDAEMHQGVVAFITWLIQLLHRR